MSLTRLIKWPWELVVTTLLWLYYTLGFCLIWLPVFLVAALRNRTPETRASSFQSLIHHFYRSFFCMLRVLCPRLRLRIDPALRRLKGCVLVSNHRSYLDPILLTSIFPRHGTVVRDFFFRVPFFGWVLRQAGYLPSGRDLQALRRGLDRLPALMADGGVFFIFPEGTRRRDRDPRPGPFRKGSFGLAAREDLPLGLMAIRQSDRLFPPDGALFRAADRVDLDLVLVEAPRRHPAAKPSELKDLAELAQKRIGDACDA